MNKVVMIDKIVEIILGLVLLFKGETVFGATLITFGMISIRVTI